MQRHLSERGGGGLRGRHTPGARIRDEESTVLRLTRPQRLRRTRIDTVLSRTTYNYMDDKKQAPPPSGDQPSNTKTLVITRDPSFVRIAADDVVVIHRERDVQISLIVDGPDPVRQALPGARANGFSVQEVHMKPSFTEVGRIGLDPKTAFSMAMNIVEAAIEARQVPIASFRERFLAMLDEHADSDAERPSAAPVSPPRQ